MCSPAWLDSPKAMLPGAVCDTLACLVGCGSRVCV